MKNDIVIYFKNKNFSKTTIFAQKFFQLIGIMLFGIAVSCQVYAAGEALMDRPSDKKLEIEPPVKQPQPSLSLPPVQPRSTEQPTKRDLLQFTIKQFKFVGNTVFSDQQLTALVHPFLNTQINAIDMEQLRLMITNHYINHGYINSGALFPDQNLENGLLVISITEGKLTHINLKNAGRLNQDYILDRIKFEEHQPLQLGELQNKLFFLQQNPRIKRINASLLPTERRGESSLDLLITEEKPYRASIELNNHKAPSIGEDQLILSVSHYNLSGAGDRLDLDLNKTEGMSGGNLHYAWSLNAQDATLDLEYGSSQTEIVNFDLSNIESKSHNSSIGVTYPLYRSIQEQYSVTLKLGKRHSETLIAGIPTGLLDFCTNGKCDVTALRLSQSWVKQDNMEVFALSHTLNIGLNALNSTIIDQEEPPIGQDKPPIKADSEFTSWHFQFQWAKRNPTSKIQSILRTDLQIAKDPLLSMERIALTGANVVRGYRESEIVRDNGLIVSLESRVPINNIETSKNRYHIAFFYDFAKGWNTKNEADRITLNRFGLGLRWAYTDRYQANIYWAKTNDTDDSNCSECDARQDKGIHFQFKAELL